MRYLQRAARRLEAGPSSARPAIPSRSPLAEADQRLNLDSFASHFDRPFNVREQAPFVEEEPGFTPFAEREFTEGLSREAQQSKDAPRPSTTSEGAATFAPRSETTDAASRTRQGRETPSRPSTQTDAPTAHHAERPAVSSQESLAAPENVKAAQPARPRTPNGRRPNALPDPSPSAENVGTRPPDLELTERARLSKTQQAPAEKEAAAESVFEALGRAMSWVERGERRAFDEETAEGRAAARPAPHSRTGERTQAWPARATPRDTRPVTHLEIGKIEVEVVAPPRPAQTSAPPRPAQGADGFGRALRQTFGWRQR